MTTNPYSPPQSNLETTYKTEDVPALWNPKVASILAFFFTPIFGALVNMKNWQAMGEPERASQSKMWVIGSVAFFIVLLVAGIFLPETGALGLLSRFAGLGFFIAWYMISGKDQKDVVEYRYGTGYTKRGWTKPVLLVFGTYLGFFIVLTALAVGYQSIAGD